MWFICLVRVSSRKIVLLRAVCDCLTIHLSHKRKCGSSCSINNCLGTLCRTWFINRKGYNSYYKHWNILIFIVSSLYVQIWFIYQLKVFSVSNGKLLQKDLLRVASRPTNDVVVSQFYTKPRIYTWQIVMLFILKKRLTSSGVLFPQMHLLLLKKRFCIGQKVVRNLHGACSVLPYPSIRTSIGLPIIWRYFYPQIFAIHRPPVIWTNQLALYKYVRKGSQRFCLTKTSLGNQLQFCLPPFGRAI